MMLIKKIVLISAIIHDIGRCEDIPGGHTAITENGLAKYLPEDIASDGVCLGKIRSCVARHSISSKEKPETLIEKIIFDADNLTIFTLFGFKRWFFKAESWGKSKTILEAEAPLLRFHKDVIDGEFLYLLKSIEIAKKSFYFKSCQI